MKFTEKASPYFKRLSKKVIESIPDSVLLLTSEDNIPFGVEESKCIIVINKLDTKDIIDLANSTGIGHIVHSTLGDLESEISISSKMILQPQDFTNNPVTTVLGIDRNDQYFNNEMRWNFTSLSQKEKIKKEIINYLNRVPNALSVKNETLSVVDELFMNALLHSSERDLTLTELRTVNLDENSPAIIFIAYKEDKLLVGCIDHSGSLDTRKMLRHLWASYRGYKVQSINVGSGGAGLGCRLILNQSIGFYAGVMRSERTVVMALLSLDRKLRMSVSNSKNLHLNF